MVSERDIKGLELDTIEDYFDYILDSKINGNSKQSKELFCKLSQGMQGQRAAFFDYIEALYAFDLNEPEAREEFEALKSFYPMMAKQL